MKDVLLQTVDCARKFEIFIIIPPPSLEFVTASFVESKLYLIFSGQRRCLPSVDSILVVSVWEEFQ